MANQNLQHKESLPTISTLMLAVIGTNEHGEQVFYRVPICSTEPLEDMIRTAGEAIQSAAVEFANAYAAQLEGREYPPRVVRVA